MKLIDTPNPNAKKIETKLTSSTTNTSMEQEELLNKLKENKILIRDRSSFENLENCVRITIGSKKQIIKVLDVINDRV